MTDSKLKPIPPKEFTIKLTHCGTDTLAGNYSIMKEKDALLLANRVINCFTNDFVGKERSPSLRFDIACLLLNQIEGYDKDKLHDNIKNAEKRIGAWVFKEPKKENNEVTT